MESYLSYLHQTLGLDHVILPPRTMELKSTDTLLNNTDSSSDPSSGTQGLPRYHFQCVSTKPLTAAEDELFQKIIAALKLGDVDYSTAVGVDVTLSPITVIFSDAPDGRGAWHVHGSSRVLHTHSVSAMLKDPQLKKECWAHLQTIKNQI